MVGSPTYNSWKGAIQRCYDPNVREFERYGGRGIHVCRRWRESFLSFLADMGLRPPQTSLDRIDNNGNYEPSNCRWADRRQQQNNKRDNRTFSFQGETLTVAEWARKFRINSVTLRTRIERHGWPIEKALTVLIKPRGARTWSPH